MKQPTFPRVGVGKTGVGLIARLRNFPRAGGEGVVTWGALPRRGPSCIRGSRQGESVWKWFEGVRVVSLGRVLLPGPEMRFPKPTW